MKAQYLPQAAFDTVWVVVGPFRQAIAAYLLVVNLWAFALMWFDKRRANQKGARRIRERTLFLSALLGGGPGAFLGMWIFRHKTKHWYFVVGIPLIAIAEAAAGYWLYLHLHFI